MDITTHIAKQCRGLYFGGNWTDSNFKDNLADVTWQQATRQVYSFNTIATLVYHTNYYLNAVMKPLQNKPLDSKHKYSFDCPPIDCQEDWEKLLEKTWADAEFFAELIEKLPENKLWDDFFENKYGNFYKNIHGVIEHSHYHLGQIVLIKKIVLQSE